jgi:flavin-dependent dehydrogenase
MRRIDVAIIGAGPAGCAAAIALHRLQVESILLIEADLERRVFVESLPPDIRLPLAELGLFEDFEALGFNACHGSASSWDTQALGYNDFLFNPHGHGWNVERRGFDAFLREQAVGRGVVLRLGMVSEQVVACNRTVRLRLRARDGVIQEVHAEFVLDASGQASRLACAMGAERLPGDRFVCVSALTSVSPACALGQRSMLEAVEYGWWYAARFDPTHALFLVAVDIDEMRARGLHRAPAWEAALRKTHHLGAFLPPTFGAPLDLVVRQARSARMTQCAGPRWLAVGDAASMYDPLSSQGVHKALTEGLAGARRIHGLLSGRNSEEVQAEHDSWMCQRFADYLRIRNHFYARQTRWAAEPFWRGRRQADGSPPS